MNEPKRYYVSLSSWPKSTAYFKPQKDFGKVLERNGFKNLGLKPISMINKHLGKLRNKLSFIMAAFRLKSDDVIAVQYPEPIKANHFLFKAIIRKRPKLIVLVHDFNELRHKKSRWMEIMSYASVIITHSPAMTAWLEKKLESLSVEGNKPKIVELEIFDYIFSDFVPVETNENKKPPYSLVFAGNFKKSHFLDDIKVPTEIIKLHLFGPGVSESIKKNPFVEFHGVCQPDEILGKISSYDFGLVWDGTSADSCTGPYGEYVKYNSPYKISAYLAAGIPVVIWDQMAKKDFVETHGVGICVSSLNDLPEILKSMTPEQYGQMKKAALKVSKRLASGYYYEKVLKTALSLIE